LAPSLDAFRWTAGRAPASSSSSRAKLGVASHYLPEFIARRMPDAAHVVGSVTHRLPLDYTFPEVDSIDSGGDCKDFNAGNLMNGHFVARDDYIGSFGLGTSPFAAPAGQLTPTGAYGGNGRRSASPFDLTLLYPTREEAVKDGLARLRKDICSQHWDRAEAADAAATNSLSPRGSAPALRRAGQRPRLGPG
jgi:hypothetical protein